MRGRDVVKTQHKSWDRFLCLLFSDIHSSLIAAVTTRVTVISLTRKLSTAQVYSLHHSIIAATHCACSFSFCILLLLLNSFLLFTLHLNINNRLLESLYFNLSCLSSHSISIPLTHTLLVRLITYIEYSTFFQKRILYSFCHLLSSSQHSLSIIRDNI